MGPLLAATVKAVKAHRRNFIKKAVTLVYLKINQIRPSMRIVLYPGQPRPPIPLTSSGSNSKRDRERLVHFL